MHIKEFKGETCQEREPLPFYWSKIIMSIYHHQRTQSETEKKPCYTLQPVKCFCSDWDRKQRVHQSEGLKEWQHREQGDRSFRRRWRNSCCNLSTQVLSIWGKDMHLETADRTVTGRHCGIHLSYPNPWLLMKARSCFLGSPVNVCASFFFFQQGPSV